MSVTLGNTSKPIPKNGTFKKTSYDHKMKNKADKKDSFFKMKKENEFGNEPAIDNEE